jgi:hypothetical protein
MEPIRTREDLVNWIDSCVLGDLRTLRLGIDGYFATPDRRAPDGRGLGGGNFLLVAGCCLALDYFGWIYLGRGSDEANVLAYIVIRDVVDSVEYSRKAPSVAHRDTI